MKKIIIYMSVCFFVMHSFAAQKGYFIPVKPENDESSVRSKSLPEYHVSSPSPHVLVITTMPSPATVAPDQDLLKSFEDIQIHKPSSIRRPRKSPEVFSIAESYDKTLFTGSRKLIQSEGPMIIQYQKGETYTKYTNPNISIWKDGNNKTVAVKLPGDTPQDIWSLVPSWVHYAEKNEWEKGRFKKASILIKKLMQTKL